MLRKIRRFPYEEFDVFDELGVIEEWNEFFRKHNRLIAASLANPGSSYCPQPALPLFCVAPRPMPAPMGPWGGALITQRAPLEIDPITHADFPEAHRRELQAQMRRPSIFFCGSALLLRLRYGDTAPVSHALPWFLAYLAFSEQDMANGSSILSFVPVFTTTRNLDGEWTPASINMMAPLGSILLAGLELTAASKLDANSKRMTTANVGPFDLNLE